MERRNIQATGGSSYAITLPKQWITKANLGKDTAIELHELANDQLLLRPARVMKPSLSRLEIMYLKDNHLVRELIGMYVSGVEEIELFAKNISFEQRSLIRTISYKLFGFELFEETSERILLKNVATSTILPEEYCKKMLDMIIAMFVDLIIVIQSNNKKLAKDIVGRDVEIDRIHLIILRHFNQTLSSLLPLSQGLTSTELHYYEHVAIRLERVADHIVRIAHTVSLFPNKTSIALNKFQLARLKKLDVYFTQLKQVLFPMNPRNAHTLLDLFESQPKNEFINAKLITTSPFHILIEDSIERIRSYIANIAEETINYAHIKK